jgi:CheY-like chemotaxis protein
MNIQKALVVDDSKVAHLTLRKLLTERGIQVDWVGSGEDAITYMEKQKPDIIFMDVMMPGLDGFETAHAITNNPVINAPPVIMCSANATEEDRQNAKRSGAIGFLSKPYTPAQMDQILTTVSGSSAPAAKTPVAPSPTVSPTIGPQAGPMATPESVRPASAPGPAQITVSAADLERNYGDVIRQLAEKAAREVARTAAEQAARQLAEEAGRKAAQAAVQAAQEAAKKAAADIAKTTAAEVARAGSEQVAREISQEVAKKITARELAEGRENLTRGLEEQIVRIVRDALGQTLAGKEFKQQLQQIAAEALLPKAEKAARQATAEAVQEAIPAAVASVSKRANLAFMVSLAAFIAAMLALIKGFLI